jgi:S-adenosyl-L-methionine hydrolase (adenosine-forming)
MIVLFTDYGADDIYVAQLKVVLLEQLPAGALIIDLLHSVPSFHIRSGAHLLAALQARFAEGAVFVAVVDPGVGTDRDAVILQADGKWYVGPDNGLLSVVAARAMRTRTWRILWRPPGLAASFHGRDLFAPAAAWIARGELPIGKIEATEELRLRLGRDDLSDIIYIDHYGNALTGLRARGVPHDAVIAVHGRRIPHARIFADVPAGSPFWYENSIGLVELAMNGDNTAERMGLSVGDRVNLVP